MSLPPVEIPLGAMRFNSGSQKLEYFNGDVWMQVHTFNPDLNGGARGVLCGAYSSGLPAGGTMDYVTITTGGNAADFGDLTTIKYYGCAAASSTRGVILGGDPTPGNGGTNVIDYITISSPGNAADFGDLTEATMYIPGGGGNQTRAIRAGGVTAPNVNPLDTIDYITIAQRGNATDFGNLATRQKYLITTGSPTRMVMAGGISAPGHPGGNNIMQYITVATTGNATDFGDLLAISNQSGSGYACSPTRGLLYITGYYPGSSWTYVNTINYVTMASLGNASDFGDLTVARGANGVTSNSVRAINAGGDTGSGYLNTIDYVTITTAGNAVDFGDRTVIGSYLTGLSNGHGGL